MASVRVTPPSSLFLLQFVYVPPILLLFPFCTHFPCSPSFPDWPEQQWCCRADPCPAPALCPPCTQPQNRASHIDSTITIPFPISISISHPYSYPHPLFHRHSHSLPFHDSHPHSHPFPQPYPSPQPYPHPIRFFPHPLPHPISVSIPFPSPCPSLFPTPSPPPIPIYIAVPTLSPSTSLPPHPGVLPSHLYAHPFPYRFLIPAPSSSPSLSPFHSLSLLPSPSLSHPHLHPIPNSRPRPAAEDWELEHSSRPGAGRRLMSSLFLPAVWLTARLLSARGVQWDGGTVPSPELALPPVSRPGPPCARRHSAPLFATVGTSFPVQTPVPSSLSALFSCRNASTRLLLWLRVPLAKRFRISLGQHHLQRMPDTAVYLEYYNPGEHGGRLEPTLSPWRAERVVLETTETAAYCRCTRARQ